MSSTTTRDLTSLKKAKSPLSTVQEHSPKRPSKASDPSNDDAVRFLEEVNSIRRRLLHRLDRKWRLVDEKYAMLDKLSYARNWANHHPIITVFLLTTFVICALPLVCFLASLAGIVFIVVIGFLFFEGSMITLGVSVLGALFTFGAFLSISFSACVIIGYLCVQYGRHWSRRFNRLSQHDNASQKSKTRSRLVPLK